MNFGKLFKKLLNQDSDIKKENETNTTQKEKFENLVQFAITVIKSHRTDKEMGAIDSRHPVFDVMNLIGRNLQSEYISKCIYHPEQFYFERPSPDFLFVKYFEEVTSDGRCVYDLLLKQDIDLEIHLNKDLIIAWPWDKGRLKGSILNIGKGKCWGEWSQDGNHNVTMWLPLGIAWVNGGNHSIASGIIQDFGVLKPTEVFDISPLYEYIHTDGEHYYRTENGSVICEVESLEIAALYEIGRLIMKESIPYL